jgi:hypothetical protein
MANQISTKGKARRPGNDYGNKLKADKGTW